MSPHDPLPAYDMSLSDHGFEAHELKGLTYPLGDHAPAYGEIYPLAPDMGWIRMPVPAILTISTCGCSMIAMTKAMAMRLPTPGCLCRR